ncbi:aquaporin-12A-like [Strongylocentrotus purpuratus]|uniref:Aquaporin n=1 Tax=Strongylocentrotus purpuratus TaxID=7668 RepID=A0A7M7P451_STRPU|nr:aquaporin-12A-like [Strongylocentrotus purpuratus]|eukprot:XP_780933.1 PREDICTED: aquaporin-12A-like [Strongylocentrotus purpuratus]
MTQEYPAVLATFLLVFFTTVGCNLIRSLTKRILRNDPVWYSYAAELISTFQLVAGVIEGDIILEEYGLYWYALYLWILFVSESLTFDGDSTANTCMIWQSMLKGDFSPGVALSKICLQVVGGQLAYPYVRFMWKVVPTNRHQRKVSHLLQVYCASALNVSILEGGFAEALATLTYFMTLNFQPKGKYSGMFADAAIQVLIIVTGLEWTGMMFNPALAAGITLNCGNQSLLEHLLVYWAAPLATVPLARAIAGAFNRPTPAVPPTKED